jgi:hypothetical protein
MLDTSTTGSAPLALISKLNTERDSLVGNSAKVRLNERV